MTDKRTRFTNRHGNAAQTVSRNKTATTQGATLAVRGLMKPDHVFAGTRSKRLFVLSHQVPEVIKHKFTIYLATGPFFTPISFLTLANKWKGFIPSSPAASGVGCHLVNIFVQTCLPPGPCRLRTLNAEPRNPMRSLRHRSTARRFSSESVTRNRSKARNFEATESVSGVRSGGIHRPLWQSRRPDVPIFGTCPVACRVCTG
jgi:hypothetical protein